MISKLKNLAKRPTLRSQLLMAFMLMSVLPLVAVAFSSYLTIRSEMIAQTRDNLSENIRKSNIIIDTRLSVFDNASEMMNIDRQLYDIFSTIDREDELSIIRANRLIQKILIQYVSWQDGKYSAHLVTSYFRFGEENKNFYPPGSFEGSPIDIAAKEGKGAMVWVPTYDYLDMFGIEGLRDIPVDYHRLFSSARQMNLSTIVNGSVRKMPSNIEQPVLVINFTEDYLISLLQEYSSPDNLDAASFAVMTTGGHIVCASEEKNGISLRGDTSWLAQIPAGKKNGSLLATVDGQEMVIAYTVSDLTGWVAAIALPSRSFLNAVTGRVMAITIPTAILLALMSFGLSSVIARRFSQKVLRTLKTIEEVGEANFDAQIQYDPQDEFAFYYSRVNQMGANIKNLIHENYEVRLRQKDVEIMALNIQLDPHFLYNTLNIINWTALDEDAERTSEIIVALSRMLQYTSDNSAETTVLADDLEWIRQYVSIMALRYEDKFTVEYDIPQCMMEMRVPKLFLQPIVENAIIHAFKDMQTGGRLVISGMRFEDEALFSVEDNGTGMSPAQVQATMEYERSSIGIRNTDRRIKVLYGQRYGVGIYSEEGTGTIVTVSLPNTGLADEPTALLPPSSNKST